MTSLRAHFGKCLLITALASAPLCVGAEVVFQEFFDNLPDWHSGLPENNTGAYPVNGAGPDRYQRRRDGHTVPDNWDSVYQDPKWAPSMGYPGKREAIEILAANSSLARGGSGKSFVQTRDSSDENSHEWWSDGQLLKFLGGGMGGDVGYAGLYIEFYIAFSPNWTLLPNSDQSKIFRVGSWSGEGGEFNAFGGGDQGPLLLWDWKQDTYGVRNSFAPRGGPHGFNYVLTKEQLGSFPRGSMNYTADILGMGKDGIDPILTDKLNGGNLPTSGTIEHQQIFDTGGTYTKVAFYVQMNSAPGAADGRLMQWIDDVQILNVRDLTWVPSLPTELTEMPKWNFFSIGGNDFFHSYPDSVRRQEWFSIDDLVVRTSIPEMPKGTSPPNPPASIDVR
jgi:hypothetical protein